MVHLNISKKEIVHTSIHSNEIKQLITFHHICLQTFFCYRCKILQIELKVVYMNSIHVFLTLFEYLNEQYLLSFTENPKFQYIF